MIDGLKPCPFCGGEGSAYQVLDYPEKIGPRFSVICNGCGASVTTIFQSEWTAIDAWNRRAERTCRAVMPPSEPGVEEIHVCSGCGRQLLLEDDDEYCPRCGARIEDEEA